MVSVIWEMHLVNAVFDVFLKLSLIIWETCILARCKNQLFHHTTFWTICSQQLLAAIYWTSMPNASFWSLICRCFGNCFKDILADIGFSKKIETGFWDQFQVGLNTQEITVNNPFEDSRVPVRLHSHFLNPNLFNSVNFLFVLCFVQLVPFPC